MAKKEKTEVATATVPQLVLRADDPRHLRALIAVHAVLGGLDELIRQFELYQER